MDFLVKVITALCLPMYAATFNVYPKQNVDFCTGCSVDDRVCDCTLTIEHKLTMMYGKKYVQAKNGMLYMDHFITKLTDDEAKQVITADGENSRLVITVNKQFPGPRIEVYEGQDLIVRVINKLHTDSVTIHFHGLHQRGTPWMDGVAFVTQCPILPGQTFVYKFKPTPSGTAMYHAHIGDQRSMGLYGPVIVRKKDRKEAFDEIIISLQDWNHDMDAETSYNRMITEQFDFKTRQRINTSYSVDGGHFSRFVFHSGLVNGKGRYYRDSKMDNHTGAPLERFELTANTTYHFRIIGAATLYPMRVYIDDDDLQLYASDGFQIGPISVQSIVVNPGERYDFFWTSPSNREATKKEYFLVAETLEVPESIGSKFHAAEAILSLKDYNGLTDYNPRNPRAEVCLSYKKCRVFNCPFLFYPSGQNRECVTFNNITNTDDSRNGSKILGNPSREMFFNFAFPGKNGSTPGSVNGREFVFPTVSLLTQKNALLTPCDESYCKLEGICRCTYKVDIKEKNANIQMVFLNMGQGHGWSHPVHLHGHSFYVMKMGYSIYDDITGKIKNQSQDILCDDPNEFCHNARWRDPTWNNGNISDLNYDPPEKDTIIVPTGGYVVVRILTDNPGLWFLHCHIDLHNTNGMAMIIDEVPDDQPPAPTGFPVCLDFFDANMPKVRQSKSSEYIPNVLPFQRKFCTGCSMNDSFCECELNVGHGLTMMLGKELVKAEAGYLYTAADPNRRLSDAEVARVITADGNNSRLIITINDQFPGPRIEAYEGQDLIIKLTNSMHTDSVTVHFHGLHQRGTPWMDGVAFVSQCPIFPGQTFVYKFKAYPAGTALYHAHIGDQRSMGLYGPVVIRKKMKTKTNDEIVVTLQDWNHDMDAETAYNRMITEQYDFSTGYVINTSYSIDNGQFSRFVFQSGLVNGKGRFYWNGHNHNGAPLERFSVKPGKTYRFRVVSAATLYPMRVYIEGDELELIASDGFEIEPLTVQSIVVHPGERYDFKWTAPSLTKATKSEYFFVAESIEVPGSIDNRYHAAEAILSLDFYSNTTNPDPLNPKIEDCHPTSPCKVFNCPYMYYPPREDRVCVTYNDAKYNGEERNEQIFKNAPNDQIKEFFFNFGFPGKVNTPGSVNGREFISPTVSALTQKGFGSSPCDEEKCKIDGTCACSYRVRLEKETITQMVFLNMGQGRGWSHPVHLHGHSFAVMKMGYGTYSNITGKIIIDSIDIICDDPDNFCINASWSNSTWNYGNIPGMNDDPPEKDTIIVPTGGYVVVRFLSDNPGLWFFHCHIDLHNTNGMGMIIDECPNDQPQAPDGFPECGNFFYDGTDFFPKTRKRLNDRPISGSYIIGRSFPEVMFFFMMTIMSVSLKSLR